jgi:hypothetical protein
MPSASVPNPETGPNAPVETPTTPARPEHVPEKFWNAETGSVNTEALLKSYTELEKARSKPQEGPGDTNNQTPDQGTPDANQPPQTPAQPASDDVVMGLLKDKGLNPEAFSIEIAQNGKLSDESYASLEKAGFSRAMVDQYVRGAQQVVDQSEAQKIILDRDLAEIKKSVAPQGSDPEKNWDVLSRWAVSNLSVDKLNTYNNMVSSGNKAQAFAAVAWLNQQFVDAEGSEPSLLAGGPTGNDHSLFRSSQEVVAAMRDKRYGVDPAYTEDIARKVARSKVFETR